MGNSTVFKGLAENIALRYKNRVTVDSGKAGKWVTGDSAKVDVGGNAAEYGHIMTSSITIAPKDREITYYRMSGNADINATNIPKNKTVIVEIDGTATIKGNITYADEDGNPNNDVYKSEDMDSIYNIPQAIIFATNIDIEPQVTQIDAWLMVGLDQSKKSATKLEGSTNGEINTCANGIKENTLIAANGQYGDDSFFSDTPAEEGAWSRECNSRLKVNGPVQAKKLRLLRSYGAGMGLECKYNYSDAIVYNHANQAEWPNGGSVKSCGAPQFGTGPFPYDSATPAEVFNLRADAYLWAYRQTENYSQAFVTYSREVAPRF
jgi:hypothetical protein